MVGIGGKALGQLLAALAAAFFLRAITGPGTALAPEEEKEEEEQTEDAGKIADDEEAPGSDKVFPVTFRWSGITCSLSDKRGKMVSRRRRDLLTIPSIYRISHCTRKLVQSALSRYRVPEGICRYAG